MANTESLSFIDDTPIDKTLKKIDELKRESNEKKKEHAESKRREETAAKFTKEFLAFSSRYFSLPEADLARLDPEECHELCEKLLEDARRKGRLPWRMFWTAAIWASWIVAVALPLLLIEDKDAAKLVSFLFSGVVGGIIAGCTSGDIWDNSTTHFLKTYAACLEFTDKPGAWIVEHAREAQKEIASSSSEQ